MEGEVEADAGVMNDAGKSNFPSEPPSGPNHTPSAIHGPVDIDYTVLGLEQGKLVKLLDDRGAVEGLIDNSTGVDVKIMELADVFHDERDKIIDFLLTDCEQGKFRRKTLQEYNEEGGVIHRLVYWQHYGRGNKFVEFLLDVKVVSPDKSTNIMELAPLDEDDLSEEATAKLVKILALTNTKTVKRGVIKGELSFTDFEFGQTAVTMVGTLKAEERVTEMKPEVDVRTVKSFKSVRSIRSSVEGRDSGRTKKGDVKAAYAAVKGIVEEVGKKFRQPAVIDERRKMHFVELVMPNVPTLTEEEDGMLESVAGLEEELYKEGKRVKGTLKEGIDKFLWRDGDNVWAAFGVTVDKSAEGMLAELSLGDTYTYAREHLKENGNLLRVIRQNVDGTRSHHQHTVVHVPSPAKDRLFEAWFTWKEIKLSSGRAGYLLGFVPLTEYPGGGFKDLSKKGFMLAETTGVYFFNEIAPNVCRVTRVQTVDLKFSGIHKTVMDNAIDYLAKNQLIEANRLQEKFRRNGKEVDAEVRGALVERMREGVELEEDQKKVFKELEELFGGEDEGGWKPQKSPYEGVKMQIKYRQQVKGERSLALGQGESTADCTAEEAAAWFFEYCSRERTRLDREEGNPARFEIRKADNRINEKLVAFIKKMPKLLNNRDFMVKLIWRKEENGSYTVTGISVDGDPDYGENTTKLVRGTSKLLITATNIKSVGSIPQCNIRMQQYVDLGGFVPTSVLDKKIPNALGVVAELRTSFNKDEEVDIAALASLANIIKNEHQDYTDEEKVAVRKAKEFYEKCKEDENFDDLKSPDERVKMKLVHVDGASSGTGFATTVVDTSVEECAAYEFSKLGNREDTKNAKERDGITFLKVIKVNPHTIYYVTTRELGLPGFVPRDGRSKITWCKQDDGKVVIDVEDTKELQIDFPVKAGNVLGKAHTVWIFEPLHTVGDVPQTSVTITTKVELGGVFYSSVMNKIAPRFLAQVSNLRKKFDRSRDIDTFKRQQIIAKFEEIAIEEAPGIENHFDKIEGAQEISSALSGQTLIKAEKGMGWGKTSITVRASHREVAAFFWGLNSGVESQLKLHRVNNQKLVVTVEHKGHLTAVRFSETGQMKTDVEMMTRQEGLGKASSKNSVIKHLGMASDAACYFDNLLKSTEAEKEDGRRFGEQLIERVNKGTIRDSKVEAARQFIAANRALREITEQHGFIRTMLYAVVINKFKRRATNEGEDNSEEEARGWEIGSAIKAVMLTTLTAAHAVDEWAHQFTEVQEVMNEQEWLRPMLEEIVKNLFMKSTLGLKARVTFGAATSMVDLLTDVYVTYMFWSDKKYGYFKASLASLVVSIGFQMLAVWMQNRKLGMLRVMREWFPILIGFKPAVDAYRMATGAKQEVGAAFDAMLEMSIMKCAEMFAEAIPGVIIQLMAIATSDKDVGISAWLSLAVSAITTGFASATISYDFDTDPASREVAPDFYGYIPANASKRTEVFVSMMLFTAGMLLIRCTSIVLLGLIGGSWAFLYIGADLGLYMLVKILRGDFWYWAPLGGNMEIVISILCRVVIKIIVDFTSIVHYRHPYEVGGAYWLFGLMLTIGSLPMSIYIASPYVAESAIDVASTIVKYSILLTTLCFAIFFSNIEKKYWHTFWSTQKSKDYSMAYFLEGESEKEKFIVFYSSRHQWVSIEGEIKKWVELNWAKWEEEKPDWFTDVMKAKVPVEFIPTDGNARRRESVRRASVDANAEGSLAGAVRASIRRASVGGDNGNGGALVPSHAVNDTSQDYAGLDPNKLGKLLGEQLLVALSFRKKGMTKEEAVRSFVRKNYVLRQAAEKYPFFTPMLGAVVKNKLVGLRKVAGQAMELGEKEGMEIGESLARSLAINTQPVAAVDAFILNFPALQELDEEYEWFRPMLEAISYRLLEEVPWGLKARVTVGAITSMIDLLTDVYVTYMFWDNEKYGYFKASLASLAVSIWIQILVVWGQNRKLGLKRVLMESFPILIGFKPAVDAYRVAKGEKQEAGQAIDVLSELSFMKCIEMFAEAIPGVIIQLMAVATNEGKASRAAWLSISVSALTTGFSSASISYDWDTDPVKREQVPDFYGYVPANPIKRLIIFVSMMLVSAGMLVIRCMTIVVLGLLGGRWVSLYVGADLILYLLVKILRGDFWYWIPAGGNVEIVSSIVARVLVKVVTDFTSIVHFRHSYELGGMYWVLGFVLTMGSLPVAILVAETGDVAEEKLKIAWKVIGRCIPVSIVCFTMFFFIIEKKYWRTFFSLQTGKELTIRGFREGKDDGVKAANMAMSKHHWSSIVDEVKAWVEANWQRWEDEKPNWFDEAMRARVPIEYIPGVGDARRKESVRRASVDAEAEGGIAGTFRASIRRASVGVADGGDIIGLGGGKAKVSSVLPRDDDAFKRQQIIAKFEEIAIEGAPGIESHFEEIYGAQEISSAFSGQTLIKAEKGMAWGKTTITARASHKEVAAFFWNVESLAMKGWEIVKKVTKRQDFKMDLTTTEKGFGKRVLEYYSRMSVFRVDNTTLVITCNPTTSAAPLVTATWRFSKLGEKKTKIELMTQVEHRGGNKSMVETSLKRHLEAGNKAAIYFSNLLCSEEAEEKDGKFFGEALMQRVEKRGKKKSKDDTVSAFTNENCALNEVVEKYPWFVPVLKCAVLGEVRRNHPVSKKLEEIGEEEAIVIGNNLTPCLKSRKIVEAGVDQWRLQNTAMWELFEEYPWMNAMFVAVGYGVVRRAPWGLQMRVTVGAVTSMIDLLTDVYVTYMFWSDKKYGYFKASLASLAVSVGIQMLAVWAQNKKLGMLRVLREWFPILIGFKPAVDAYRVAAGEKQQAGHAVDHMYEMTVMKCIEMFAEAIPGVVIQLMAIATSKDDIEDAAWVSLSVSAITAGYASATISYDFDTDPVKREQVPDFYGYVPANPTKRSIIFVSLMLFSAGMLVIRCMTIVVLGLLGGRWVSLYVGADLLLYLFVKILRGDFWYWVPLGGNAEIMSSIVCRLLVKVVTDFTSIVQFRHPNEVGGMYWMFGFVLTMGSLPVAILVADRIDIAEEKLKLAWKVVGIFIPSTVVLFAVFFFSIEKKYLCTFYSLQRGKDLTVQRFRDSADEASKADSIFTNSKHHWELIEEEVKAWVEVNWDRWVEDKPKWFDDAMRAKVPVEYIPGEGDARRRESARRASVDAEAEGGLAGSLRASIRRASVGGADGGDIIRVGGGNAKVSSVVPRG